MSGGQVELGTIEQTQTNVVGAMEAMNATAA
jgi:hypothetical protein